MTEKSGASKQGGSWPAITAGNMDAILRFLPTFQAAGFSPGKMIYRPGTVPIYELAADVGAFLRVLSDNNWIVSFDWTQWEGRAYLKDPSALANVDIQTAQKLFTVLARQDRFCEGFLGSMIQNGFVTALLQRVEQLRKSPQG